MLTVRERRIVHKAERVALRKARREGHMLTTDELLELKVQILPDYVRWLTAGGAVVAGIGSWIFLELGSWTIGSVLAVVAVLLLAFSIFGIRKTLESIGDGMGHVIVDVVFEHLGDVFGGV